MTKPSLGLACDLKPYPFPMLGACTVDLGGKDTRALLLVLQEGGPDPEIVASGTAVKLA